MQRRRTWSARSRRRSIRQARRCWRAAQRCRRTSSAASATSTTCSSAAWRRSSRRCTAGTKVHDLGSGSHGACLQPCFSGSSSKEANVAIAFYQKQHELRLCCIAHMKDTRKPRNFLGSTCICLCTRWQLRLSTHPHTQILHHRLQDDEGHAQGCWTLTARLYAGKHYIYCT